MKTLAMVSQCASCKHLSSWLMGGDTTCAAYPEGIPDELWDNDVDHRQAADGDSGVQWASNGDAFPAWVFGDDAGGGERAYPFAGKRVAGGPQWMDQDRDHRGRWTDGVRASLKGAATTAAVGATLAAELRGLNGGRQVNVDFEDADVQIAREYAEGILRGQELFPHALLTSVGMADVNDLSDDEDDDGAYATAFGEPRVYGAIYFDHKLSASRESWDAASTQAEGVDEGWNPKGWSPVWLAAHEFGHLVNDFGTEAPDGSDFAEREATEIVQQQMESEGLDRVHALARYEYIRPAVSGQATLGLQELVAEAFADVAVNGDDAAPVSRSIVDALKAEFARTSRSAHPFVRAAGGPHWRYQWRDPGGEGGGQWISGPPTGLAGYKADWLDDIFDQIAKFDDPGPDLTGKLKLPDLKVLAEHAGLTKSGNKASIVAAIVGHAKGERPVVATKAPRKPAAPKATTPRAPAVKDGVWIVDEAGEPRRVPRSEVPVGVDTYPTKAKAALGLKPRPRAPAKPRKGYAYVVDMSNDDNPISRMPVDEVPEGVTSFSTLKEARGEVGRQTVKGLIAEGALTPEGKPTPAGATKYGPGLPFNPRVHGPGTRVYWVDDQTGERIYGTVAKAGRTTVVDWDGGRREPIDPRRISKDIRVAPQSAIITNAAVGDLAIRLREAHGLEHDEAVDRARQILAERNPGATFEMDAPPPPKPESDRKSAGSLEIADLAWRLMKAHGMSHNEAIDRATELEAEREARVQADAKDPATLAKAKAKVKAGKAGRNLTEAELVALIADMQANGPSPEASARAEAILAELNARPTLERVRADLKGVRPQRLRDMARELGIDPVQINRTKTKAGLIDLIAPVLYARELAEWMERSERGDRGPLTPEAFEVRATTAEGRDAENLPPVQAEIEAAGSDSATWKATGFAGLQGAVAGATTAVTRYLRTPSLANDRLRFPDGRPLEESWQRPDPVRQAKENATADRDIAALDKLMARSRLPEDVVVWRGAALADMGVPEGSAVGHTWVDPGFVSTSARRSVAENDFAQGENRALLRILTPAGTPALGFQGLGEAEVLLGRGLRFRVVADRGRLTRTMFDGREVPGARLLDVEVLPGVAGESVRDDGEGALPSVPAERLPADRRPDDVLHLAGAGDRAPGGRPDGTAGGDGAGGPALPGAAATDDGSTLGGGAPDLGGDVAGGRGRRDGAGATTGLTPVPIFRPRSQADLAPSNSTKRLAANIEALETLRAIQLADRPATAEEQAKLARWSGWGSIPKVFKEPPDLEFADAQARLKELLSPAEFAAARRTIRNAHYTDAAYVEAMWDAMRELGFEGGEVLEPGSGSGTFMGMVPEDIEHDTHVTGVELDPTTAAIARALYPNQTVRAESFAESVTNDGAFDAVIGNVPFSDTKLFDPDYNPGRRDNMHNHFILKSLRMTRPGGLVAVITSRYTMDSVRPDARQRMAQLGDLVGAVRLPSRAHEKAAGTSVVTDVLIFRRRPDDTPYAGLPFEKARTIEVDGREVSVNELFIDNPDRVLGRMAMSSGLKDAFKVQGEGDVAAKLREALGRVVADARAKGLTQTEGRSPMPAFAPSRRDRKPDGFLQVRPDGTFTRLEGGVEVPQAVPSTQRAELRDLLRLRDTAMKLIDLETVSEDETDEMRRLRAELNELYDSYVATPGYGPVSRYKETRKKGTSAEDDIEEAGVTRTRPPVMKIFRRDPFSAIVRSLEEYDVASNTGKKTDIFRHRVIAPRAPIDRADNPADALAIALDDVGEVDLERIGDLLGEDDETVVRRQLGSLVFDDPTTGRLVPRAEYLSGNIRRKLADARRAAIGNDMYAPNVEALERVMPADLTPAEIRAKMGAGWIPTEVVQDFLREILRDRTLTVSRVGATWEVDGNKKSAAATKEWGTTERSAVDLAMDVLMSRPIKIEYKLPGGGKQFDQDRTDAAQAKALEMAARFETWAWENPERSRALQARYNELFNSLVLRAYDGDRMELPGMAREGFYEYPHRYQAIRRIINEPSVGLWHEVGSGKTSVMVISAMEMRRLGLVRKPAIVVPNHMLEQMTREFHERYPQARLLPIGSDDLKDESARRDIIARAATGDWDAVILTHGAFKRIPVSSETEEDYLQAEVGPMRRAVERRRAEVIEEVRAQNPDMSDRDLQDLINKRLNSDDEKEKDPTLKDLEGLVQSAEENIKEHQGSVKRDPGLTFERTGIDYLFVDEAHTHKNLRTMSRQPNMGIPGSQIALDLHMKLHHLRSKNQRVATLATATPIANSVGEAYTMMRYLRPDLLEDMQIDTFDDFASNFGEIVSRLEVAPTGGLRTHSRFARFVNVPEFLKSWLVASDVKTAEDLKDIVKVPLLKERVDSEGNRTRTPDIVVVPPSDELKDFVATLVYRAQNIPYPPQKGDDNMLKITGEGRAAALDLRMVGRSTDAPQKLDIAADRIASIYQANKDRVYTNKKGEPVGQPGALQLVFSDIGTPTATKRKKRKADADDSIEDQANDDLAGFVAYEELRRKLMERGIPREKIKFIHEAGSDEEKAQMFAAARDGSIAVLVGSTSKMGVGTNVQKRAIALHHLDAPWRPADVQQREGRIIRQGNDNPEVEVIRYVTEGSFDSYIWQAITTKGTFINQIMRGSPDVREMEDIGDFALSAAQVTALGTGNPYLIEHADAKAELSRIERRLSIHEADQRGLPQQIAGHEANIARWQQVIANADAALARRTPTYHDDDKFRMTVAGTTYTDRGEAYEALRSELRKVASSPDTDTVTTIGEFGGIPIQANPLAGRDGVHVELAGIPHRRASFDLTRSGIMLGAILSDFTKALDDLDDIKVRRTVDIDTARVDIEAARARIGRPFPEMEKLAATRRRFEKVDADLRAELAARGETLNEADDVAARREAKMRELRDKLDTGGGFDHLGELTSWLEADPSLATAIPADRGKAWGKLTPRGQLLVMKDEYGKAFDVKAPRTMKSYKPMLDFKTQREAVAFAEALEESGIPWNTGVDLDTWQAPGGASAEEVINRIRGERFGGQPKFLSDRNEWIREADRLEARRLVPERFRDTLLADLRYRDDLGVDSFTRLDREHRELILGILRGAPENDLEAALKLREFGLSKDESQYYSLQRFLLEAALKLEGDYRRDNPQPLDEFRKRFQAEFAMGGYPQKRARIEQVLSQGDLSGDLGVTVDQLRALAADFRNADGYDRYTNTKFADIASALADQIEQHIRTVALREQAADWSDAELRALAAQRGVEILPYDDRSSNILSRLAAAGVSLDVADSPAGLVSLVEARSFLDSFTRPWKDGRHGR